MTIPDILSNIADRLSNKKALISTKGDSLSYKQLLDYSRCVAHFIRQKDIKSGSTIGLLSNNCIYWPPVYFGILMAGCIVVPLDPLLSPEELTPIIKHSDISLCFVHPSLRNKVLDILDEDRIYNIDDITEDIKEEILIDISPEDVAVIIYTSGTTGNPKGVMLTHKNIVSNVKACCEVFPFDEKDTFLSILPLHHTFECTAGMLVPISKGSRIVYPSGLSSKEILKAFKDYNVTLMVGVPLFFEKFIDSFYRKIKRKNVLIRTYMHLVKKLSEKMKGNVSRKLFYLILRETGLSNIRFFISGAAALPERVIKEFEILGIPLLQGYGLTECSPVVSVNRLDNNKVGSSGLPLPGISVKIGNPNNEGVGEILVKGENVMKGYYKNKEATSSVFDGEYLRTGDCGYIDKDGFLFITGRIKDIIVTGGGKNVYPEELENILRSSPYIKEVLVMGMETDAGYERVSAIIVPEYEVIQENKGYLDDNKIEELIKQEVKRLCNNLAPYKRVQEFTIRKEEFPKTSTKKIKRYLFTGKRILVSN